MRKRILSWIMAVALAFGMVMVDLPSSAERVDAGTLGIANNGLEGISIDIYSSPYRDFSTYPYGQNAYTTAGCAWFASARANQLMGTGNTIRAGSNWNRNAATLGLSTGYELKAPALACWGTTEESNAGKGHVAVIEKILNDGSVVISEGGNYGTSAYPDGNPAGHDYCIIRKVSADAISSIRDSTWLGYVYLPGASAAQISHGETRGFVDTCEYRSNGTIYIDGWGYDKTRDADCAWMRAYMDGVFVAEFGASAPYDNNSGVQEALGSNNHKYYRDWPVSGLSAGAHTVRVVVVDSATGSEVACDASEGVSLTVNVPGPTISNARITDKTPAGYTFSYDVSDPAGVDSSYYSVWTEANGQDDVVTQNATLLPYAGATNVTVSFRVSAPDHQYERGNFLIDVTATNHFGVVSHAGASYGSGGAYVTTVSNDFIPRATMTWGNSTYEAYVDAATWAEAEAFCEAQGGHLITITSEEENSKITEWINGAGLYNDWYWTGLLDAAQTDHWQWVNGEEFSYYNWADGQPDHVIRGSETEHYGRISPTGAWYDHVAGKAMGFILEREETVALDEVHFPDAAFRTYLKGQFGEELDREEIANTTELVLPGNGRVQDLTGIEYFTELKVLDCSQNRLTGLDLRKNKKLESLSCYENRLTTLYLAGDALEFLNAAENELTTIDLSQCPNLKDVILESNALTILDFSNNPALRGISASGNPLTAVDLSKNTKLEEIFYCDKAVIDFSLYPNLNRVGQYADVTEGKLNLSEYFTGITAAQIHDLQGGTLDGLVISGINGTFSPITFRYGETQGVLVSLMIRSFTGGSNGKKNDETPINWISVNRSRLDLSVGEVERIQASVFPVNADCRKIQWRSSNPNVARVIWSVGSLEATVIGNGPGTATITITINGSHASVSIPVTVTKAEDQDRKRAERVLVFREDTGIEITGQKISLEEDAIGNKIALSARVTAGGSTDRVNQTVVWTSSKENVASVDANGVVTARSRGTTTISAIAADNSGIKGMVTLVVGQPEAVPITKRAEKVAILLDATDVTGQRFGLDPDEEERKTIQLSGLLTAGGSSEGVSQDVLWTSSNKNVATVDESGLVTAIGSGAATITAAATDGSGKKGTVTIGVTRLVQSLVLTGPSEVGAGKSITLTATALPDSAVTKTVTWTSGDVTKATVSNGKVTAKKNVSGTVTITATAKDGSGVTATKEITILTPAEKVTILSGGNDVTGKKLGLDLDESGKKTVALTTALSAANAANGSVSQDVLWTSSNVRVATVDANGLVTAGMNGTATITAAATDGSGKKGSVTVNVTRLVKSLAITGEEAVGAGKSITLTTTALPDSATDKKVTWVSSDPTKATVSNGKVTAKKNASGTVTITATANDGSGVTDTKEISILTPAEKVEIYRMQDGSGNLPGTEADYMADPHGKLVTKGTLGLDPDNEEGVVTLVLSAGFYAKDAATGAWSDSGVGQGVVWTSSKPSIAAIETSEYTLANTTTTISICTVKALARGTATITATAADGSGKKESCTINVSSQVRSVAVSGSKVVAKGKSVQLLATALPDSAANKKVAWTSSDPSIATVSSAGKVTGKNEGTVTITATATDGSGRSANHTLQVTGTPIHTVKLLSWSQASLDAEWTSEEVSGTLPCVMEYVDLRFTAKYMDKDGNEVEDPTDAGMGAVWTSSAPAVASVDADGKVTLYKAGTAKITATAVDGSGKSASVTLNVTQHDLLLTGPMSVAAGKSITITQTGPKVKWSIEDPEQRKVASVSGGRLTVKANHGDVGDITVTATEILPAGSEEIPQVAEWPVTIWDDPVKGITLYNDVAGTGEAVNGQKIGVDRDKIAEDGTLSLSAITYGKNEDSAVYGDVIWTSSNAKVVTINAPSIGATCAATVHAAGTATITATAADGSGAKASVTVNVASIAKKVTIPVPVNGISYVAKGKTLQLSTSVLPDKAASKAVNWEIASVNPTDNVTLSKNAITISKAGKLSVNGTVPVGTEITVKATATDGGGAYDEALAIVTEPAKSVEILGHTAGQKIGIDRDALSEGNASIILEAKVQPSEGDTGQSVIWTTSNAKVATVEADTGNLTSCTVTPRAAGTATITATTTDGMGKKASVIINVASLMTEPTISTAGNVKELAAGKALQFTAVAAPNRTAVKTVAWDAEVKYPTGFDTATLPKNPVTISKAGKLSVNAKVPEGTKIEVVALATDGGEAQSSPYTVTVTKAAGRVELYTADDTENVTVLNGKKIGIDRDTLGTLKLKAAVYEELKTGATITNISQGVIWTTSNAKVVTVDSNGVITAIKAGTATVTATTTDGSGKKASVTVNVAGLVQTLTINGADTISGGKAVSAKYTATATPARAADKSVTWSVSAEPPAGKTLAVNDVKVAANGTVSLTKNVPQGTTITLTATAKDGSLVSAVKTIVVE